VREDGRIVGGEERQEKLCNREEWKKLQRMARNPHILHMPMELMNDPYVSGYYNSKPVRLHHKKQNSSRLMTFYTKY
jgi:hypothetical protein